MITLQGHGGQMVVHSSRRAGLFAQREILNLTGKMFLTGQNRSLKRADRLSRVFVRRVSTVFRTEFQTLFGVPMSPPTQFLSCKYQIGIKFIFLLHLFGPQH